MTPLLLVLVLSAQSAVPSAATPPATTPPAASLSPATSTPAAAAATFGPDEMAKFLATAKVVAHHSIEKGISAPLRLTLSDGTTTHDAAFSFIDEHKPVMELDSGRTELNFVDSYKYNLAAYGLTKVLGLDGMMPVTVPFQFENQPGALSWWVDVMMDECARLKKKLEAPDQNVWGQQIYRMRVFAALVGDTDRNEGNILYGPDWKLWMIDFTRAFRTWNQVQDPKSLTRCDMHLLGRLRILTADRVAEATKPYLTKAEIDAVLARRDGIVKIFDELIKEKGAGKVLY